MDTLINYLKPDEILELKEQNPFIDDLSDDEVKELVDILINLGCRPEDIGEIVYANPFYLDRTKEEVDALVQRLYSFGIRDYRELFTSKPWILDKDSWEIDEFVKSERVDGASIFDILEKMEKSGEF